MGKSCVQTVWPVWDNVARTVRKHRRQHDFSQAPTAPVTDFRMVFRCSSPPASTLKVAKVTDTVSLFSAVSTPLTIITIFI